MSVVHRSRHISGMSGDPATVWGDFESENILVNPGIVSAVILRSACVDVVDIVQCTPNS